MFVRNVTDKHYITYAGDLTSVATLVLIEGSTRRLLNSQRRCGPAGA